MCNEITTALIAFIGVLLGLGASYIFLLLQRRWALDDKRREWERNELEKYLEIYKELWKIFSISTADNSITHENRERIRLFALDLFNPTFADEKLLDVHRRFISKISEYLELAKSGIGDEESFVQLTNEIQTLGNRLQKQINRLKEETYS